MSVDSLLIPRLLPCCSSLNTATGPLALVQRSMIAAARESAEGAACLSQQCSWPCLKALRQLARQAKQPRRCRGQPAVPEFPALPVSLVRSAG